MRVQDKLALPETLHYMSEVENVVCEHNTLILNYFFASKFTCVCSCLSMTQYKGRALVPRISFASYTAKIWRLSLHPMSNVVLVMARLTMQKGNDH